MEHILRPIYQERASLPETLGVIEINKRDDEINVTDTFDTVLLIVVKTADTPIFTKHYLYQDKKMVMHIITEKLLNKWLLIGSNRKVIDWLFYGKVIFERNEYLSSLKLKLQETPFYGLDIKKGIEYSKLIRQYLEGKEFFNKGEYLDAYQRVVNSLHHLARLAVIDSGLYPEVTVWSQVKIIDPEIYKLYEELVLSNESLEKRLELLFLAIEFLISSKTSDAAKHILKTMLTKEHWTIQELHKHEQLSFYSVDLEVYIEYLVDKGFIYIKPVKAKNENIYHRHYYVDQLMVKSKYENE